MYVRSRVVFIFQISIFCLITRIATLGEEILCAILLNNWTMGNRAAFELMFWNFSDFS